jgi:iron-sulfur cluster repair protein YtfE (RIC family)
MTAIGLESSVPDWLIEYPQLLPIFEELGIDYCCGGKSLERACQERGIDAQTILTRLRSGQADDDGAAKR